MQYARPCCFCSIKVDVDFLSLRYNVVTVLGGLSAKETRSSLAKVRIYFKFLIKKFSKKDF